MSWGYNYFRLFFNMHSLSLKLSKLVMYTIRQQQQQQQPYPVNPTNSKATYRVWGGWDVDRPCLYP
ncbi:hypothetical protein Hanom_Chr08g00699701 [Helianthus anomalus]